MTVDLDPNRPSTSTARPSVSVSVEQIAQETRRLQQQRRQVKLDREVKALAVLEEAKRASLADPANIAAKARLDKQMKGVMRHIRKHHARCHPEPEPETSASTTRPSPAKCTSTMMKSFVEAAATGLVDESLQPNPNHPHVASRLKKARSANPVPNPDEDEENTDDTGPPDDDNP